MNIHPLQRFVYCPVCGQKSFVENDEKSKRCTQCGFVYYFNPSAAVACFIRNINGELLLVRRAKEPGKGTLDLPGGFMDRYECAEEAVYREVMEETGLEIHDCRYLFSLPNVYPYEGFEVHTVDLFFECFVDEMVKAHAADDAAEIIIQKPMELSPENFGLHSIRKAVQMYKLHQD